MSVPRREVNSEFQTVFLACLGEFSYHITFTILIRCVADAVICGACRPEAEAVVMFGCNDDSFHARSNQGSCPLFAIQFLRIEGLYIRISVSPFLIIEGVEAEMDKSIGSQFLPCHLLGGWHRLDGGYLAVVALGGSCYGCQPQA